MTNDYRDLLQANRLAISRIYEAALDPGLRDFSPLWSVVSLSLHEEEAVKALLSLTEAARVLGVSRNTTLPAMIAAGVLRVVQFGERVRVPAAEIDRLCKEGFVAPAKTVRKYRVKNIPPAANLDWEAELRKLGV